MATERKTQTAVVVWSHRIGSLRRDDEGELVGMDLLPAVSDALATLESKGFAIQLVVRSRGKPDRSLARFLPPGWTVQTVAPKTMAQPREIAALTKSAGDNALFIASDRVVRAAITRSGGRAWPDPATALLSVKQQALICVCVRGDALALQAEREFIPYFVEHQTDNGWMAIGLTTRGGVARCVARRFHVTVLALDPRLEDPLLVHLDRIDPDTCQALTEAKVLLAEPHRLIVAVGADIANDELGLHGAHGHYVALWPDAQLWDRSSVSGSFDASVEMALVRLPADVIKVTRVIDPDILKLLTPSCPTTAAQFESDLNRYTGIAPLDESGAIVSRHYRHSDNARAVTGLLTDLRNMGYCPYVHEFEHNGRTLHNVIADLPGRGRFIIAADIWEKLRQILIRHPFPDPPDPWIDAVTELLGKKWVDHSGIRRLQPLQARSALERLLLLYPWYPWWRKLCPIYGLGAQIVIVGCHMDSTANFSGGYVPETSAAPGTDDDGSGLVATLSIARWMRAHHRGRLTHTVRFCFFNAEESGLVGSKAYASMLKSHNAPVRAVICSDMMGFNSDANRIFEVHAGYTDPAIRDASVPIADRVAAWAASLGQLAAAQIYKGTNPGPGADRNINDGAINRSDHSAFHEQGYPAVLVSEDFFANLSSEPGNDPNPNYHRQTDTTVDCAYAADITCAVAQAAREAAA